MPTIESEQLTIRYETMGDDSAPPVVLLPDADGDSRAWLPAARELAEDYWLILAEPVNPPSPGGMEAPGQPGADDYVDALSALLAELGIEICAVAGLGFGAWAGIRFALSQPEKVAALVAGGTLERVTAEADEGHAGDADVSRRYGARVYGRRRASSVTDPYLAEGIAAHYRSVQTDTLADALASMASMPVTPEQLESLRIPLMVVSGETGPSRAAGDRLAVMLPQVWRVRIREGGVDVAATKADVFAKQLSRFFGAVEEGQPMGSDVTA